MEIRTPARCPTLPRPNRHASLRQACPIAHQAGLRHSSLLLQIELLLNHADMFQVALANVGKGYLKISLAPCRHSHTSLSCCCVAYPFQLPQASMAGYLKTWLSHGSNEAATPHARLFKHFLPFHQLLGKRPFHAVEQVFGDQSQLGIAFNVQLAFEKQGIGVFFAQHHAQKIDGVGGQP